MYFYCQDKLVALSNFRIPPPGESMFKILGHFILSALPLIAIFALISVFVGFFSLAAHITLGYHVNFPPLYGQDIIMYFHYFINSLFAIMIVSTFVSMLKIRWVNSDIIHRGYPIKVKLVRRDKTPIFSLLEFRDMDTNVLLARSLNLFVPHDVHVDGLQDNVEYDAYVGMKRYNRRTSFLIVLDVDKYAGVTLGNNNGAIIS